MKLVNLGLGLLVSFFLLGCATKADLADGSVFDSDKVTYEKYLTTDLQPRIDNYGCADGDTLIDFSAEALKVSVSVVIVEDEQVKVSDVANFVLDRDEYEYPYSSRMTIGDETGLGANFVDFMHLVKRNSDSLEVNSLITDISFAKALDDSILPVTKEIMSNSKYAYQISYSESYYRGSPISNNGDQSFFSRVYVCPTD